MSESLQTVPGGLVVVFEGIDGTGKSTQIGLAQAELQQSGWLVHATRSHGGTDIGEQLRKVSLSDAPRPAKTNLFISLAMHAALAEDLATKRREGAIILVDRGPLSVAAYQLYGDGLPLEEGWPYVDQDVAGYHSELTLLYHASLDIALARARQKPGSADYFEKKPVDYFQRVADGYQVAAERYGATPIDAEPSIDDVHHRTMELLMQAVNAELT